MLSKVHPVRAPQALIIMPIMMIMLASPFAASARSPELPLQPLSHGQFESTHVTGENTLLLDDNAPLAPLAFGAYSRFGFYISAVQSFATPVASIRVEYVSQIPQASAALIDVRSSLDAVEWSLWQPVDQSGAVLHTQQPARFAQYRVALMANQASPQISSVQLLPQLPAPASQLKASAAQALTFKVRATRQGMVGGRTANGHIITKRDRFVSLPCWCSLSTRNGNEYKVRLTYKGRSTVVPVYDVGPWNRRDNYWDPQPQRYFSDLRQGWPQDHAAYYDDHNGGRSGLGWKVTFPTAVDVGDGAWWDDLKIVGDRAELEVTFLWTGNDPVPATPEPTAQPAPATPQPAAPTVQPDATAEPAESPTVLPEATALPEITPPPATGSPATPEPPTPVPATVEPTTTAPTTVPATPEPSTLVPTTAVPATAQPTTAPATLVPATATPPPASATTTAPEATAVPPSPVPATVAPATAIPTAVATATALPTQVEDSQANTLPQKPASDPIAQIVDDGDSGFQGQAKVKWYDSPKGCGWNEHALWTYSADKATNSENSARWSTKLPAAGRYTLQVYIPDCKGTKPATQSASYSVVTAQGQQDVSINQAKNTGKWVSLGMFAFGTHAAVELHDITGEDQRVVWFDAVRWVPENR